jgi:citrate lyase beta subunit
LSTAEVVDGGVPPEVLAEVDALLAPADAQAAAFAGESGLRQPVHTVYVPADKYRHDLPARWGAAALRLLDDHAGAFAECTDGELLPRVRSKLAGQPVEDLRVDFEDGYGARPDDEEDAAALAAGRALAVSASEAGDAGTGDERGGVTVRPPFLTGVRIKGFEPATRRRGLRTLDLVVRAAAGAGGLPGRFVVVLPKVTHPAQVTALVAVCEALERSYGLAGGALRFEVQVEVPQAVVGPDGAATVARLVHAAGGRCEGLHYGTYDFSAAAGVPAGQQALDHPLADHAKAVMQIAAAGTGVRVSDGSTNVVPVGDAEQVRAAWRLHAGLVDRALRRGLYQGWDLHPGHLPTRFAATYAFLRSELALSGDRLRTYVGRAAAGVVDEPATAQALAATVLRAVDCGACDEAEALAVTGLDRAALGRLVRRET